MDGKFTDISAVIFDLDNTVFDHSMVQHQSLSEIYNEFSFVFNGTTFENFFDAYIKNNEIVWNLLIAGKITRDELRLSRFSDILAKFELDTSYSQEMTDRYLEIYSGISFFMEGAPDTLKYLRQKYKLGIVTNGFKDIQDIKIDNLGVRDMFKVILTSEEAGVMKPHPDIFRQAAEKLKTPVSKCLFVGDSYDSDVAGAAGSGMKPVWFNPSGKEPSDGEQVHIHAISTLWELTDLL